VITVFLLSTLTILALTVVLGLVRAVQGPSLGDRLTSVLLLGTSGIAMLFLLASLLQMTALIDVALVLALLSAVVSAALTREEADDA
jgi:multicomponent Na+:H+ antiporter subunit F